MVDDLTKKLFKEIAEKVVSDTIEETMQSIIRNGGIAPPMTTISNTLSGGLTLEKLKEAMKELEALPPRLNTPMDYVLAGRWMATDRMCNQMVPARPLVWKSWHERAGKYAFRTRKKWLKRFGLKPAMDKTQILVDDYNQVVHLHTDAVRKIAKAVGVTFTQLELLRKSPGYMIASSSRLW